MKSKIHILILAMVVGLSCHPLFGQQDPLYGLYLNNPLLINPAYAGLHNQATANLTHRSQWAAIEGAPKTSAFNIHSSLYANRIGAGLILVHDKAGVTSTMEISAAYAYKIEMHEGTLSLGLQASLFNVRNEYNDLTIKDELDGFFIDDANITKPNFGTGIYYASEKLLLGFSIPRLMKIKSNQADNLAAQVYNQHFYLMGSGILSLGSKAILRPSLYLRYTKDVPLNYDIRTDFIFDKAFMAGLFTRGFSQLGFSVGVFPKQKYRIVYQYELPVGALEERLNAHEITLGINFSLLKEHDISFHHF